MPHAEFRGKLSRTGTNAHERSEDLLTSDVFGRLRYLEPDDGLLPVLARAVGFGSGHFLRVPEPTSLPPDYHFWPWIRESEPDVLINWTAMDGTHVSLVVECKYLSGKSGAYSPNASDQEADAASADADQLCREYHDLCRLDGHGVLLYITGHWVLPQEDFQATVDALRAKGERTDGFTAAAYWLGWPDVWVALKERLASPALSQKSRLVLEDMVALLAHKGYRRFESIPVPSFRTPDASDPVWYRHNQRPYHWSPQHGPSTVRRGTPIFYDGGVVHG